MPTWLLDYEREGYGSVISLSMEIGWFSGNGKTGGNENGGFVNVI